ncbi:carbohydrate ABC transporter substrate-binding protein [Microtetraspora sp. AC03309]|uniref:ABC transporter substrate-binding protein n=1 Tax=Microtetraspora sp. AC03309 TaxID=2779376 RepID=UPI001E36DCF0|nr:ABC transporter substrate-binding protein [Microtetraspora sp. AC03309]MCC5576801.1 carbohydrate ABC transporter substrate-binding protein [Microtetraspora sp. AC03309]
MRRRWLAAVAVSVAGLLTLTACGGSDDKAAGGGQSGQKKVEVFSWWTGPGEADGLKAMREIFEKGNPGFTFYDAAVAGGSGDQARALLSSKLQANQPPDTFQGHAGAELQGYIKAGKLEPLNFLYDELKLKDVLPQELIDQISVQGQVYSVPVNIHRSNVLWFNPSVLKAAGISEAPKTIDEFIADLGKVKKTGKIPLSIGSQWTAVHLLESVMLGSLGTDAYNELWTANADWSGANVTKALENFKTILSYAGTPQEDWQPAAKQVADGEAAFNIMGDWAYGYFHNPPDGGLGKQSKADFDWAASPGTDGTFMWLSDSFTLPKGAPNRDGAVAWLKVAASKEGQDAFNPKKGSIPARKDADKSLYQDYLAWDLDQWASAKLAGSIQHGVVANDAWRTAINDAVGLFQQDQDVAKFQQALIAAAKNSGQ